MRLVGLLVGLVAMLAASAGPYVGEAKAYGNVGSYWPAYVVCDAFAGTMEIRPQFGASRALSSQWLTYQYYIYDIDRRQGYWTATFPMFQHSAVYVTGPITEYRDIAWVTPRVFRPGPGRFKVWTRYWWYDGGWFTRDPILTTGYEGFYYDGGGAYCRTSSVAG
jgi:hypothetical protein